MSKLILIIAVMMPLTGCGAIERSKASLAGYSRMCVNGVSYLQFTSGATVEYLPSGEIAKCK